MLPLKNPMPVIGWFGGNVLSGFRITIDYPNRESYWLSQTTLDPHDLDQVGLTLALKNGGYFVAAIATQNAKRAVEGVQVRDKLLRVDSLELRTSTWGAIFSAMHGKPGDIRTLRIERNDKPFTVQASIQAF
jgi:C-terminal processing protease CtpA/Prc